MSTELLPLLLLVSLALGLVVGYMWRAFEYHCPPPLPPDARELAAVQDFRASLWAPDTAHAHVFSKAPDRTDKGWSVWQCQRCPQEHTARATRIKPEDRIV